MKERLLSANEIADILHLTVNHLRLILDSWRFTRFHTGHIEHHRRLYKFNEEFLQEAIVYFELRNNIDAIRRIKKLLVPKTMCKPLDDSVILRRIQTIIEDKSLMPSIQVVQIADLLKRRSTQ